MPLDHPRAIVDALLEQNDTGFLLFDRKGQIVFANELAARLAWPSSPSESVVDWRGKDWGSPHTFDGDPIAIAEWPVTLALEGKKSAGREARMVRSDGSHYDISMSAAPLRTEAGDLLGAVVSFTDITQRRLAEQNLTAINERLKQIATDNAPAVRLMYLLGLSASSITSIKEMFQIVLAEICTYLGWQVGYAYIVETPGQLHGITAWYSSDPRRYETLRNATSRIDFSLKESVIGRALKDRAPVFISDVDSESFLRRVAAREAGLRCCLAIPVLVHGEPLAILEFFNAETVRPQDSMLKVMETIGAYLGQVIEQKRAEQKLQVLFDSAPDAQIVTDGAGKIIMANRQTTQLFGYSQEELIGQPVELLVPPDLRTKHIEDRGGYIKAPHPRPMGSGIELRGFCKNRAEVPVEVSLSPIETDDGLMIASTIRDVTERKKLELSLREKERLAEIGTTAAIFAHEIGNPLGAIRIAAQAIEEVVPSEDQRLCTILLAEIDRLVLLLEEFRSLSTVNKLNVESLDLFNVLDRVVRVNSGAWAKQGVRTVREFFGSLELKGDEEKLQQVVLNLCKNAVESMPAGGVLTLRGEKRGQHIILEICDTGHGIPHGVDVFKLFDTTKPKGAGIGLYVVRQIVEAHYGTISYTSDPGNGTIFRVHLPITQNPLR